MWSPQIPSWTSSRIYFASSSSTHLRYGMEKPFLYRVSFRIVNLAARFLTFLASSVSTGRHPSHRKERIGFIFWFWITKVQISLILRCLCTFTFKLGELVPSFDDACLATSFAYEFWLWGTCMKSTRSNSQTSWFINLRYFCILLSFALYSPFICPITSLESLLRSRFLTPKALLILSLVSMSSYSALLLVARN